MLAKLKLGIPLLFLLLPVLASAQVIAPGEVLTLSAAIDIALKAQPSVMAGSYTVKANEATIGQARSVYYPQMSATAAYSRVNSATSGTRGPAIGTATPGASTVSSGTNAAGGSVGPYDLYTGSASVSQMIYDFGRTSSQVRINTLTTQSSRYDLASTQNTVVLNVKQAYYAALQAERNLNASRQAVKQLQEHLDQAGSMFAIGTKTRFDVTQAEVNLSNAKLTLIQAENQVRLTRVNLNNAIAVPDARDYRLEYVLLYEKFDLSLDEALKTAYERRPDLQSIIRKKRAVGQSVTLAREGYLPQLNANATYYYTGTAFPLQNGWSYGLNLSIPIFSGFLTRYQVQQAQANLGVADANERALRLTIFSQVQQDFLNLRASAESIAASSVAVRQARDNVELATGRYQNGVGIALDVIDAIVTQLNTEVAYTQALASYKNAQAAIENDMGMR